MSEHYFTSDLHFHHAAIQRFAGRPWNVEEQTEALINIWNSQVKPNDFVYHLGDFCFGMNKEESIAKIIKRLNGNIHFILGNHCKESHYEYLPLQFCNVKFVGNYKVISIERQQIILFHFPIMDHLNCHHGSWMLHGHLHGGQQFEGKVLDVGIDSAKNILGEYKLFSFEDVKRFMDTRKIKYYGHHKERKTE